MIAMKLTMLLLLGAFSLTACSSSDDDSVDTGTDDSGSASESGIESDSDNLNDTSDTSDTSDIR